MSVTVIDPYIMCMPQQEGLNAGKVREYANRLLSWGEAFSEDQNIRVSGLAMAMMYDLGLEPDCTKLQDLFDSFDIQGLSAFDIINGCDQLISNYPQVEEFVGALDIDCVGDHKKIIPEQIRMRMHPEVAEAFTQALVKTSYALKVYEEKGWKLATAPFDNGKNSPFMIVEGMVNDKERIQHVQRQWPLIYQPNIQNKQNQPTSVLEIFMDDLHQAVQCKWEELAHENSQTDEILYSFQFGINFLPSLLEKRTKRPNFEQDINSAFETIVNILIGAWKYPSDKNHELKKYVNVGDQIIRRSRNEKGQPLFSPNNKPLLDKAARAHVTTGPRCLRLHYWICPGRTIEFSNITDEHDDSTIFDQYGKRVISTDIRNLDL